MSIESRLAEIRAREEAATEGPWTWGGNVDSQNLRLQTWNHRPDGQSCGVVQIMDFVRQGMQGAQPRFMEDLMMVKASDRAIYEVAPTAASRKDPRVYRGDIVGIKHPDAEFIAASRTDLPALLAAVEAVIKRADRWTSLDRPEGDDFQGGFNAGVKFAAGHILRALTAALEVEG